MHHGNSTTLIERTDQDAHLTRLAGAFLASYASPNTRRGYRTDLHDWFTWTITWQIPALEARRTHLEVWMRNLEDRQLSGATRARKLAVVRSFYNWCVDEQILDANPAHRVRRPAGRASASSSVNPAKALTCSTLFS